MTSEKFNTLGLICVQPIKVEPGFKITENGSYTTLICEKVRHSKGMKF